MSSPANDKKRSLRKNSVQTPTCGSSTFTLADIQRLIAESEERIKTHVEEKFDLLCLKMSNIENAITEIKAVQVQQESDISHIKEVIATQQQQIESFEERERRNNLIISNVPEESFQSVDKQLLTEDTSKVLSLFNEISPPGRVFSEDEILEVARLGRAGGRPRVLRVKLRDMRSRNDILRSSKNLNSSPIRKTFGRVYVNKDMSFLRRKEEKRLRDEYRILRDKFPDANVRLRNGRLFLGPATRDCVDYRNQLF